MSLRRSAALVAALSLAGSVALSGCSDDDAVGGQAGDGITPSSTAVIVVSTTTTAVPRLEQRSVDVALPVSFTAGDVVFEITDIEFSNATPGTYLEDEPDLLSDELLYVTFTARVDSSLGVAGAPHDWTVMSFKLVTGDGGVISASGVDFADFIDVSPDEPSTTSVVFPATEDDLAGARFRLDDGVNPAVEVALAAPAPL